MDKLLSAALLALCLLLPATARAGTDHLPSDCAFAMEFPEAPYKIHSCADQAGKICSTSLTFDKVMAPDSTLRIKATCNPLDRKTFLSHTGASLKTTLEGMARSRNLKSYKTGFTELKGPEIKKAGLSGTTTSGEKRAIYLWLTPQSFLSVEAGIDGKQLDISNALFAKIMKSVKIKEPNREQKPENEKPSPASDGEDQKSAEDKL